MSKAIIHQSKQRFFIVLIAALVGFFGMQALSLTVATYQLAMFWQVSVYLFLFFVFWNSFIFDLHLKRSFSWERWRRSFFTALRGRYRYMASGYHFLHYVNHLILPALIYWASVGIIFLNPYNELIKQAIIIFSTLALAVVVWHLKTVFYNTTELNQYIRQPLFISKLYGGYIAFTAAFGLTRYFGLGSSVFTVAVFAIAFLLLYQALFRHHKISADTIKLILIIALGMGIIGYFVFQIWNVNFYTGAIVIAAIYNTIWGLIHHQVLDHDLTRKVALEYIAVLFIILVIIFSTTNFSQRIG